MAVQDIEDLSIYFLGEQIPVESSNVAWIKYDSDSQWLWVGFKHGGVYLYTFTTDGEAEEFARAQSQGKWVWANCIRAHRHFERVIVPAHFRVPVTFGTDTSPADE
jgi:hypothetical protein